MAGGEWRVASEDGVASGQWSVASEDGESGETTPAVRHRPIVGHDSNRVIDDREIDKIGILSHEEMNAMDRPRIRAGPLSSLTTWPTSNH